MAEDGLGMQTMKLKYSEGGTEMEAFVAWVHGSPPQPGVLVAHTAIGPQEDFIQEKCRELAQMGYVAFALDAFGAGHCVFGREKDEYNQVLKQDRDLGLRRVLAALEALQALEVVDGSRIGAIGYCLGGKLVLDLARAGRSPVKGVVSFHGILDSPSLEAAADITARVLCFHGGRDPFVPDSNLLAFKKEMDAKGADYEVVIFGHCVHAFTRPDKVSPEDKAAGFFYDPDATRRSWEATCRFLGDILSHDRRE